MLIEITLASFNKLVRWDSSQSMSFNRLNIVAVEALLIIGWIL